MVRSEFCTHVSQHALTSMQISYQALASHVTTAPQTLICWARPRNKARHQCQKITPTFTCDTTLQSCQIWQLTGNFNCHTQFQRLYRDPHAGEIIAAKKKGGAYNGIFNSAIVNMKVDACTQDAIDQLHCVQLVLLICSNIQGIKSSTFQLYTCMYKPVHNLKTKSA